MDRHGKRARHQPEAHTLVVWLPTNTKPKQLRTDNSMTGCQVSSYELPQSLPTTLYNNS